MSINTIKNYSPNFDKKKRLKKQIKFIIIHYTGMKSEKAAIKKLKKIQSEVSSHYLITQNGQIILMVPDLYVSWHAGKSMWKGESFLNSKSIGIEITNPGHSFGYKNFTNKQIKSTVILIKHLVKKYKISKKHILGHADIAPNRKKDPGEKFPWKYLAKKNIAVWHNLNQKNLKNLRKKKCDETKEFEFLKNLIKIGYFSKNLIKFKRKKNLIAVTKSFQRRFRPQLIDGKIDQECLKISKSVI
jgi:N-acetylmuramoyl-L-alanine amidase